jgi:hypothetical protein
MSVAVSPEVKEALAGKAREFGMTGGISELMRVLAQNFLDGNFDGVEDLKPRQSKPRKSNVRKSRRTAVKE